MSNDKQSLLIVEDDAGLQKQMRWSFDAYERWWPEVVRAPGTNAAA